jgi:hypothetical protein
LRFISMDFEGLLPRCCAVWRTLVPVKVHRSWHGRAQLVAILSAFTEQSKSDKAQATNLTNLFIFTLHTANNR